MGDQENSEDVVGHQFVPTLDRAVSEGLYQRFEALEEFTALAAHELKSPLTSLWLQLQLLQRKARLSNEPMPADVLLTALEGMDRQIRRLNVMVDDLQDVSWAGAGRLILTPEVVDIVALVHEVVDRHRRQALERGTAITLSGGAPIRGGWDGARLDTAISNLVADAIKHGTGHPIEIDIADEGPSVRITIRYGGLSMSVQDGNRTAARAAGREDSSGFGLGLYIAVSIVEAHGGEIRVESAVDAGAVFMVELPR